MNLLVERANTEEILLTQDIDQPLALAEYVYNAMAKARYQVLEDGTFYADIFLCPGVWATGNSVEECRDELREVLVEWLLSAYEGREWVLRIARTNPVRLWRIWTRY